MRRVAAIVMVAVLGGGGARARADWDEDTFTRKTFATYSIPTPPKGGRPSQTVIGSVRAYRIRKGDTLIDLARWFSLGYNEITEANPGVDPWIPPAGSTILLPTEWVLPCCTYEGLIVNIPEMRLFLYRRASGDPHTTIVHTFPVGLGRDDWRTPSGKFKVRGKTVNPQWNIPESIRKEHIAERDDPRTFIPGGDPDNPLGKYRIELTLPMYGIHGTNIPWGVGMQVSHGCVRLYPEDIEHLFPLVQTGMPGEFTYQPVKAGIRAGVVYVEAHHDIYGYAPALYQEANAALARAGLTDRVDPAMLQAALEEESSMPDPVSREPAAVSERTPDDEVAGGPRADEGNGARAARTNQSQARND